MPDGSELTDVDSIPHSNEVVLTGASSRNDIWRGYPTAVSSDVINIRQRWAWLALE